MATELTVQSIYLPNFALASAVFAAGDTVEVRWELTDDGIDDDGYPRLRGTGPVVDAIVYAWDAVDERFEDAGGTPLPVFTPTPSEFDGPFVLYIPEFEIDPTADWLRPRPGHYRVFFHLPDGRRVAWQDWQDIIIPVNPAPTTWRDISLYNKGGVSQYGWNSTYTKEEIDAKITAAIEEAGGLSNPMTAAGDIIYGGTVVDTHATPTRLAVGPVGRLLGVVAGLPAWVAVVLADVVSWLGYTPENAANKGAAGGYTALDGGSKVATANLGTGAASASTALAGDRSWKSVPSLLGYTPENLANKNAASGYPGLNATAPAAGNPLAWDGSAYGPVASLALDAITAGAIRGGLQTVSVTGVTAVAAAATIVAVSAGNGTTRVDLPAAVDSIGRVLVVTRTNLSSSFLIIQSLAPTGADTIQLQTDSTSGNTSLPLSTGGQGYLLIGFNATTWIAFTL
jgi:hypothetical protein